VVVCEDLREKDSLDRMRFDLLSCICSFRSKVSPIIVMIHSAMCIINVVVLKEKEKKLKTFPVCPSIRPSSLIARRNLCNRLSGQSPVHVQEQKTQVSITTSPKPHYHQPQNATAPHLSLGPKALLISPNIETSESPIVGLSFVRFGCCTCSCLCLCL